MLRQNSLEQHCNSIRIMLIFTVMFECAANHRGRIMRLLTSALNEGKICCEGRTRCFEQQRQSDEPDHVRPNKDKERKTIIRFITCAYAYCDDSATKAVDEWYLLILRENRERERDGGGLDAVKRGYE